MRKDVFNWNEDTTLTFHQLKEALIQGPVLALPNFAQPFELEAYGLVIIVGTILMQNQRPIAHLS